MVDQIGRGAQMILSPMGCPEAYILAAVTPVEKLVLLELSLCHMAR